MVNKFFNYFQYIPLRYSYFFAYYYYNYYLKRNFFPLKIINFGWSEFIYCIEKKINKINR